MYLDHFGLSRPPFKITPDTRLFYPGGSRGEILEAMIYAILSGEGIVKVVGEVGSGKTMLSRMLEIRLPDHVDIVYLANPSVAPGDIMHAITLEMGLAVPVGASRLEVLRGMQEELLRRHAEGRQVVCFVEEAQAMPLATLEEIRLLSNLETHQDKLLQIVLFGQPELDERLDDPEIRQLRERIVHSFKLAPFGVSEIREYVRFRMQAAGYRGPDLFTPRAYRAIAHASLGLVRRINIIGDKALLAAYAANSYAVTHREVAVAVADSEFGRIGAARRRGRARRAALAAGVALAAVALGAVVGTRVRGGGTAVPAAAPPPAAAEPAGVAVASPAAAPGAALAAVVPVPVATGPGASVAAEADPPREPLGSAPAPVSEGAREAERAVDVIPPPPEEPPAGPAPAAAPGVPPAASPLASAPGVPSTAPASAPARAPDAPASAPAPAPDAPASASAPSVSPAGASPGVVAPVVLASAPAAAGSGEDVPLRSAAAPPPPSAGASDAGPGTGDAPAGEDHTVWLRPPPTPEEAAASDDGPRLLTRRLGITRSWLSEADDRHFSIQLMMTRTDNWRNLERFLRRWLPEDLESLYVYQTEIRGRTWYGVLFSEYDSLKAARQALSRLPEELKRHQPYVRRISRIGPIG